MHNVFIPASHFHLTGHLEESNGKQAKDSLPIAGLGDISQVQPTTSNGPGTYSEYLGDRYIKVGKQEGI